MALFDDSNVKIDVLKKRAFNYRWAEVPEGVIPLTAADPDYPVAPEIREAMIDYINGGYYEIWSDIVFPEEKYLSIHSLGSERCRRVMSVFGFSKSFGIAGLRVGCVYTTNEELFEEMVKNSDVLTTAGGISSISQIAGMACVDRCYYWVDEFLTHLKKNRDYAVERLNQMPVLKAYKPHATYLLYVDISG